MFRKHGVWMVAIAIVPGFLESGTDSVEIRFAIERWNVIGCVD